MILSFKIRRDEVFFATGLCPKQFEAFRSVAARKLDMIHAAATLNDLRVPPGNRLEELTADRKGQHSIRINEQWRICFRWTRKGAEDVEIVDYH
jgi:proteic killer suppression protein